MPNDPTDKPKRPWAGFAYVVIILLGFLVAIFVIWPLGQGVHNVFQRLTDAFANHR